LGPTIVGWWSVDEKIGSALMAVMRKMLAVAVHLLKHEQENSDPSKVGASSAACSAG